MQTFTRLSETLFISSETIDSNSYRKEGGVGNILPWVQMRNNLNNENSECNSILIKSPSIMDGYLKESGESDNAWFDTKDCGIINESDILILKGRSRDIIKKGGVMLNLREFEILAEKFCGAIEACAVSIKHEFYGESYILYLTSNSNINTCVHEQLSRSKWPEEIRYLSEFPRTASGKIDKIKIKMLSYE